MPIKQDWIVYLGAVTTLRVCLLEAENSVTAEFPVFYFHELFRFCNVQILCSASSHARSCMKSSTSGVWSSFHSKTVVGYFQTEHQKTKPDSKQKKQPSTAEECAATRSFAFFTWGNSSRWFIQSWLLRDSSILLLGRSLLLKLLLILFTVGNLSNVNNVNPPWIKQGILYFSIRMELWNEELYNDRPRFAMENCTLTHQGLKWRTLQ